LRPIAAGLEERGIPAARGGKWSAVRWIARHKEFRDEYTLACELRAEDLADEMMEIVDDPCGWKKAGRMGGRLGSWITRTLPAFFFRMKALEQHDNLKRRSPS
jgi:hypothetical protein